MLLKPRKNRKGFTLIELIVVVAVLAILAAIAVPSFIGLQQRAQRGVDIANATALVGAVNVYNSLNTTGQITTRDGITRANLGDLWPQGIEEPLSAQVLNRIDFTGPGDAVAIVSNTSTNADVSGS